MSGMYIVFEGVVGSGKSTQSKKLFDFLKKEFPDKDIILTREPGGSEIAEKIRNVVQGTKYKEEMHPVCEAYLYAAARSQSLRSVVKPVLDNDGIVISDRSFISSVAYQGTARNLGLNKVLEINMPAIGNITPDLIIYLDYPPDEGIKRTFDSEGDKFESENVDFFKKVEEGYKKIANTPEFNEIWLSIDARGNKETIFEAIKEKVMTFLHRRS